MPPRQQPNPPDPPTLQQLQDSINTLAAAITAFRDTQDHRHAHYINSINNLRNQLPPNMGETINNLQTQNPANLGETLTHLQNQIPTSLAENTSQQFRQNDTALKPPKLRLLPFDGTNTLDWLFQAEQFFVHYSIPHTQHLIHAASYMTGDALGWFQWMFQNNLLSNWDAFTSALEVRFGPSTFKNHQQALFKLKQTGTVVEYQKDFERLGNRVHGLTLAAITDCFVSGLKLPIQNEISIHQPATVSHAIGWAKPIESKIAASRPYQTSHSRFPYNKPPLLPTPPHKPPDPPRSMPIRRLSPTELQLSRSQGLCFNCDERFHTGHRCKSKQFLLLLSDNETTEISSELYALIIDDPPIDVSPYVTNKPDSPTTTSDPNSPTTEDAPAMFHLSLQAATGQPSPRTLRFQAAINNHPVTVLIDFGSSHNIIQPRIAHFLHLPVQPSSSFTVMVGNGKQLQCTGIGINTPIVINQTLLPTSLYVIPIQGADIVLGVQWLQTLGPFIADYSIPSMQFSHNNNLITITGARTPPLTQASYHQIHRMLHTHAIATFHSIYMTPTTQTTHTLDSISDTATIQKFHPQIQPILHHHSHIFSKPKGLPPSRHHDHHIHLTPNSQPINIKPYCYPHYQKDIMTNLIVEMLKDGVIQPSTSPYSSLVLLVKKKDGTWHFCIDYRALNTITIKDCFPIPTIDELLDELHSAIYFSKIDLRSGYHQIRIVLEDIHKTGFRTLDGHYEFLVMPFGFSNAPSTFQAAMNDLLCPYLCKFSIVFFDDILIYSPSWDTHLQHLNTILLLLSKNHFYAKLSKCQLGVTTIDYLGHIITAQGVQADPSKIESIKLWPTPKNITALRAVTPRSRNNVKVIIIK